MKTQKWIKLAIVALSTSVILQSCSKEEDESELLPKSDQATWSVRPDFATLDNRPANIIAQFKKTDKNAEPVKLTTLKASGGKYALVIGISDYKGTANDLDFCDDDAIDWKNRLETEGYNVTVLLDRNATKTAIEAAINTLASLSVEGNEIAFCYSGHGSSGNIISTDEYYISSSWLKTKFSSATSKKMMFCFDACQIGVMTTALKATGRVIAVASSKNTYSYDGDYYMKNGVFTYYLMKGFDQQNYTYLEPDCQYAVDQMKSWASKNWLRAAPSYVDSYTGDFDL